MFIICLGIDDWEGIASYGNVWDQLKLWPNGLLATTVLESLSAIVTKGKAQVLTGSHSYDDEALSLEGMLAILQLRRRAELMPDISRQTGG
jgi:hypothetical protein